MNNNKLGILRFKVRLTNQTSEAPHDSYAGR